jgi:hypothetical protein
MCDINYSKLTDKIIDIISHNKPKESILLISKLKISNKNIGVDKALKIYISFSNESVEYNINKHHNNITSYMSSIENNEKKAIKCFKDKNKNKK